MNKPCADCRLYGCPDDEPEPTMNRARRHCDCHGPARSVRHFSVRPGGPYSIPVPEGDPILRGRPEYQGRVFPAGDLEAYRRTGHHDAVVELPGPDGTHYYLTREYVLGLFDLVERG